MIKTLRFYFRRAKRKTKTKITFIADRYFNSRKFVIGKKKTNNHQGLLCSIFHNLFILVSKQIFHEKYYTRFIGMLHLINSKLGSET